MNSQEKKPDRDKCYYYAGALWGFATSSRCSEPDREWLRDAAEQLRMLSEEHFRDKPKQPSRGPSPSGKLEEPLTVGRLENFLRAAELDTPVRVARIDVPPGPDRRGRYPVAMIYDEILPAAEGIKGKVVYLMVDGEL